MFESSDEESRKRERKKEYWMNVAVKMEAKGKRKT
jgi:hypothetical protein